TSSSFSLAQPRKTLLVNDISIDIIALSVSHYRASEACLNILFFGKNHTLDRFSSTGGPVLNLIPTRGRHLAHAIRAEHRTNRGNGAREAVGF
ncbi:hypothetical protein E4U43_000641, partial [Claviceps pusilla]